MLQRLSLIFTFLPHSLIYAINEPINEIINEIINEPINEIINEPINEPINESINEPINESINEPINEPISEPISEPINEPINERVCKKRAQTFIPPSQFFGWILSFIPPSPRSVLKIKFSAEPKFIEVYSLNRGKINKCLGKKVKNLFLMYFFIFPQIFKNPFLSRGG